MGRGRGMLVIFVNVGYCLWRLEGEVKITTETEMTQVQLAVIEELRGEHEEGQGLSCEALCVRLNDRTGLQVGPSDMEKALEELRQERHVRREGSLYELVRHYS